MLCYSKVFFLSELITLLFLYFVFFYIIQLCYGSLNIDLTNVS